VYVYLTCTFCNWYVSKYLHLSHPTWDER